MTVDGADLRVVQPANANQVAVFAQRRFTYYGDAARRHIFLN
jgi:hypothetical protein